MKILFLGSGIQDWDKYPNPKYGREVQMWGILRNLQKIGNETILLKAGNKNYEEIIDGVSIQNLKLPNFGKNPISRIVHMLIFSKKAESVIQELKPDIISFHYRLSSYFPSRLNIPYTYTIHVPTILKSYKRCAMANNVLNFPFFILDDIIDKKLLINSKSIIVLNKYMAEYLENIGYKNINVIPNAVDINEFNCAKSDNYILYAGQLEWVKQVDMLIEAFSLLDNEVINKNKLIIIGKGSNKNKLNKLVKSKNLKNCVNFIPWLERDEMLQFMSKCSVFVLPSKFETFGNVVIEAMASSKPVIASNIPGPQDIIIHEFDGFLFENKNVYELKKYLELLLMSEDLRKIIGRNALQSVKKKFTFDKISADYNRIFNRMLHYEYNKKT